MTLSTEARSRRLAVLLGLLVALILVGVGSSRPLHAIGVFLLSPITNRFYFGNMVATASILLLGGLGVSIAFRGGSVNLGGEGQVYLSGLVAAVLLVALPAGLGWFGLLIVLLIAGVTGAAVGAASVEIDDVLPSEIT